MKVLLGANWGQFEVSLGSLETLELVSKEFSHFEGIASFFRDWAPGTLTSGA